MKDGGEDEEDLSEIFGFPVDVCLQCQEKPKAKTTKSEEWPQMLQFGVSSKDRDDRKQSETGESDREFVEATLASCNGLEKCLMI